MSHYELFQLCCVTTLVTMLVMILGKHKVRIQDLEHKLSELTWDAHELRKIIADLVPEIESKPFHSMTPAQQRELMELIAVKAESKRQPFKPVIVPSGPPCDPPISGKPYR